MARSGIHLNGDFGELALKMGQVSGMSKKVTTKAFVDDLVKVTHAAMTEKFDQFVDMTYLNDSSTLHHVYEWGVPVGNPYARLWKHKLLGGGGDRNATWDWRASKRPIPTPAQRAGKAHDPMSGLSMEDLHKFSDRKYIFYWKAPVMESGMSAIVAPVNVDRVMFPAWTDGGGAELRFGSPESVVDSPGGEETTGSFTAIWSSWWSMEAPAAFDEEVGRPVERLIGDAVREKTRAGTATIGITAVTDIKALKDAGEDWARVNIDRNMRKFGRKYQSFYV